jgi:hypothetical protein
MFSTLKARKINFLKESLAENEKDHLKKGFLD